MDGIQGSERLGFDPGCLPQDRLINRNERDRTEDALRASDRTADAADRPHHLRIRERAGNDVGVGRDGLNEEGRTRLAHDELHDRG